MFTKAYRFASWAFYTKHGNLEMCELWKLCTKMYRFASKCMKSDSSFLCMTWSLTTCFTSSWLFSCSSFNTFHHQILFLTYMYKQLPTEVNELYDHGTNYERPFHKLGSLAKRQCMIAHLYSVFQKCLEKQTFLICWKNYFHFQQLFNATKYTGLTISHTRPIRNPDRSRHGLRQFLIFSDFSQTRKKELNDRS